MVGQTVSHFKILEKLGEGGMGVVYRARDLKLDRFVALKFLPRHLSENRVDKERFIQEAKAASALDHPNICTIYEIDETEDGQVFIAMASYEGETLKEMIRRGPLPIDKVVDLGVQMAAGLSAAHARGIVHRDVKPANFMVTRDGVVKILDFGLSKFTSSPSNLTAVGTLVGTVAYMSPEQVQGAHVDGQTDVWSLGVVLFEMATGIKPFRGSNDVSTLYRIVHDEPEPRPERVAAVPAELRAVLRRALAKDARRRYLSVDELCGDLERLSSESQSVSLPSFLRSSVILPRPAESRRAQGLTALAAVGLALILFFGLNYFRADETPKLVPAESIVVTGFHVDDSSKGEVPEWLGSALSEILLVEMPEEQGLKWSLAEAEIRVSGGDALSSKGFLATLVEKLRKTQGATRVVGGQIRSVGEGPTARFEIDVVIQGTRRQTDVDRFRVYGSGEDVLELGQDLSTELGKELGVSPRPRQEPKPGRVPQPDSLELSAEARTASHFLAKTAESLRVHDAPAAVRYAESGLQIDPDHPGLHISLADAYGLLGEEEEAQKHARLAVEASSDLPLTDHLAAIARLREAEGDYAQAAAVLRALESAHEPLPDGSISAQRLDLGLHVVNLLVKSGQTQDARNHLEAYLERAARDPRVALARAEIERGEGDREEQSEVASESERLAKGFGAPLLEARACLLRGEALRYLTRLDEAEEALREAHRIYSQHGHLQGQALSLVVLGNVQWLRPDLNAAKASYEEAADLFGRLGDAFYRNRALFNQAAVLYQRGDYNASRRIQVELREAFNKEKDVIGEAWALIHWADITSRFGQHEDASGAYSHARQLGDQSENVRTIIIAQYSQAAFLILSGELMTAQRQLTKTLEFIDEKDEDLALRAMVLYLLAEVHRYQGGLSEAERFYGEALECAEQDEGNQVEFYAASRHGLGKVWIAMGRLEEADEALRDARELQDSKGLFQANETRVTRAVWELESGRIQNARALARDALAAFEQSGDVLGAASAYQVLAASCLAAEDFEGAMAAAESGLEPIGDNDFPVYTHPLHLVRARVLANEGELVEARDLLQTLLSEALQDGFKGHELAINFAISEVEIAAGNERLGRSRLEDLRVEAEEKKYYLLLRDIQEVLARIEK